MIGRLLRRFRRGSQEVAPGAPDPGAAPAPYVPLFPTDLPPVWPGETGIVPRTRTIVVKPLGNLANRMIQHMVALSIAAKTPGACISRIELPEWGMQEPELEEDAPSGHVIRSFRADAAGVAERLRRGEFRTVTISGYVQHFPDFLAREAYRDVFVSSSPARGFGAGFLLISIRMGDILSGTHPPYVLVPPGFYRALVRETGLVPVFFGQLTKSTYLDALRAAVPEARFVPGSNPIDDFETIRRSANIVVSVSTFSWLAAWLSDAARIFLPLTGLLNPVYGRDILDGLDLLPRGDSRYRFFLFPLNEAVDEVHRPALHAALEGTWREVDDAALAAILDGRNLRPRKLADHLAIFDEGEYLDLYPELRRAIGRGEIPSGRVHYERYGFRENRRPCRIGMDYAHRHPDAGMAVADGRYADLVHFHAAEGRARGYGTAAGTGEEITPPPAREVPDAGR